MDNEKALQYWRYKFDSAKNYYDEHWDAEERHNHIDYINAMNCAITALTETAELKRLLKLIYDEMREEYRCCYCVYEELNARHTPCASCNLSIKLNFKWKHADEVMKLLEDKK